jgi:hypothetical protein
METMRMPTQSAEKNAKPIRALEQRRAKLVRQLARIGPVIQGTITQRTIRTSDPESPGTQKEYGPYYQWTWKREGKTVTVNLSATQAKRYQKAIDENKKLESLLQQLRAVSLELLEATTHGVPKRTKRPK